jgi:Protein of unknown function (DUF3151)
MTSISFSGGLPETVLSPNPEPLRRQLEAAAALPDDERKDAYRAIAAAAPRCSDAWAGLAEGAIDPVERYAYARVGYHRGLDALRAEGWRGSGFVRWAHPSNRGFLRCLDALRQAAGAIGENDEEERCAVFLRQLDPDWGSQPHSGH